MRETNTLRLFTVISVCIAVGACNFFENPPIIVAVSDTIGFSASGGAGDQGADLSLGFKGRKIAVVPVSVTDFDGNQKVIALPTDSKSYKSHSVLATVTIDGAAASPSVAVEQVVAIGAAAENWARGRGDMPTPFE